LAAWRVGFRGECDILSSVAYLAVGAAAIQSEDFGMKVAGFLMLIAGWFLMLAAIVLFAATPMGIAFVLTGCAVEALGLTFAFRSHLIPREDKR
jgi:predicted metal-binding membrane protein